MNDKELGELLADTARELGVVGAQLAIYDGEREREFAAGYRDLECRLAVTQNTLFQIGSTTKLFNAALVMSLVDIRELSLDTPVCEYIADLKLADEEARESITLRRLLSMTAGAGQRYVL